MRVLEGRGDALGPQLIGDELRLRHLIRLEARDQFEGRAGLVEVPGFAGIKLEIARRVIDRRCLVGVDEVGILDPFGRGAAAPAVVERGGHLRATLRASPHRSALSFGSDQSRGIRASSPTTRQY